MCSTEPGKSDNEATQQANGAKGCLILLHCKLIPLASRADSNAVLGKVTLDLYVLVENGEIFRRRIRRRNISQFSTNKGLLVWGMLVLVPKSARCWS